MAQIRPLDLKAFANKFAEKYYPQWLHRVDRIWDMFERIDFDSFIPESDNFQVGNSFSIAGEAGPESKEIISGIAILAFTYQNVKDKDNVNDAVIRKHISINPLSSKVSPELQQKLEGVLSEMLSSVEYCPESETDNRFLYPNRTEGSQFTKDYQVIIQPGLGNNRGLLIINSHQIGISSRESDLCRKLIDQLKKDWFRQVSERDRGWISYDGFINCVDRWKTSKGKIDDTVIINALNILNKKIEANLKSIGPDNYLIQNGNNKLFNYPKHYRFRVHPEFLSVE